MKKRCREERREGERERETMRACPAPQVSKICEEARDAAERLQQRQ